jgi:protein-S-isoprenylcysteine O-methyltransferase Ste14
MNDGTLVFIGFCWVAWLVYWAVMASATKRTVERGSFFAYRVVALLVFLACAVLGKLLHIATQTRLWHTPLALGIATDCLVVSGVAFTVWARIVLGRNWSAEVTFKQDHELIESGPYALARHPIYTGLIAMALGTAINYGRAVGFALFLTVCAALWWKSRQEEQIMSSHFPGAYPEYRARVNAIVPIPRGLFKS